MKNKCFKFRLYPTQEQQSLIAHHFWCTRFVWNYYLNQRQEHYMKNKEAIEEKRIKWSLNYFDNARDLTQMKKQNVRLKDVNSQSLQATLKNLDSAYKRFWKKQTKFPRYKKKWYSTSFTIPQNVSIQWKKLIIPKFREWIHVIQHRELEWRIVNATISMNAKWDYYVSINCECDIQHKSNDWWQVWIDLWIKDFAICSDGQTFSNPKHLYALEKRLKYAQSRYSKYKWKKRKNRVQSLHVKVANQRRDFLQKLSTRLINENQVICLESLSVSNMMKNHCLAKAIGSCSWSSFVSMLEYKAGWYWNNVIKIDRFFPSSKTCSHCWRIKQDLKLADRDWKCWWCWEVVNRDINASINILKQWLNIINGGRDYLQKQDELSSLEEAMTLEAPTALA